MLYLFHASLVVPAKPSAQTRLTCLIEADSVDQAHHKLQPLLERSDPLNQLAPAAEIHIDALVEVETIPEQGLISYYEEWMGIGGNQYGNLSTALPDDPPGCTAYNVAETTPGHIKGGLRH